MTFRYCKQAFQELIIFVFVGMLPFVANSATEEVVDEKRIEVAMRMIGHEVLMCLGDLESRIMPIEKIDEQDKPDSYRISFETEFGFDPEDIVAIIDHIMMETKTANNYLVEVEQGETRDVVHSFEIGNAANPYLIPCRGRILPVDCYSLLITILDSTGTNSITKESSSLIAFVFLMAPLFILLGFIVFFSRKKGTAGINSNLPLIGSFQFDKRNMALSLNNKRVELSNKEAALLSLLYTSANTPVEREVILQRVWGDEGDYVGRTLDVFISKLRKKLEADTSVKIVNIRGVGYKLVMDMRP